MRDPYLYDDVDVLKNKLGIKNDDELKYAESQIVPSKLINVNNYLEGNFDINKLKEIHQHLFGDIYEWAGQFRVMNIEKSEKVLSGLSVQYSDYREIEKSAKIIINKLNSIDWKSLKTDLDKTSDVISKLTAELWRVHCFREGNTRTTITFIELFAQSKGINIDRTLLKNNPRYVRDSLVLSSIDEYSEYEHLNKIIKDSITIDDNAKDKSFMNEYLNKQRNKSIAAQKSKRKLDFER